MAKMLKPAPEERRAQLDSVKLEEMMAIVIQNKVAYESVVDVLTIRQVKRISQGLALLWRQVRNYYKVHNELPAKGSLVADLHNAIGQSPDSLTDDEKAEVDEFLDYAYDRAEHGKNIAKSSAHVRVAMETCRQYLEEEALHDLRDLAVKDGTVPLDIPSILHRKQAELDVIGALTGGELEQPFPDGWDTREHVKLFTTGNSTLDELMGGGWRGSEVLLFMGPYGSCKTTLTVDSVSALITYASEEYIHGRTKQRKGESLRPVVVLMFTEGEKQDYRLRLLANLAQIPWKRLTRMESLNDLCKERGVGCTEDTEYENKEFADQKAARGEGFQAEYYRAQRAVGLCNKFLVLLDCTDSEDNKHPVGGGGVPELANIVAAHFRKNQDTYPLAFWLDHASALVDRMAESGGADVDKMMHLILKRIPRQCKDKLAKKWKAPIGIIHQLSGEANSRSILAELSHGDSAGSKQIGEYVDFAVVANKPDMEQLCRVKCTKHRREPPSTARIVRVDGSFQRLLDETDLHVVDNGRIIAKKDMDAWASRGKIGQAHDNNHKHGFDV